MRLTCIVLALAAVACHGETSHASDVRVQTIYSASVSIAKSEVTVRNLCESSEQQLQTLVTGSDGWTPTIEIRPGLYQFVARRKGFLTSVKEIFVEEQTSTIILTMRAWANIDYGPFKGKKTGILVRFRVPFSSGKNPVAGMRVLSRDTEGNDERWLVTDSNGVVTVPPTDKPDFITLPTLVVMGEGKISSFVLQGDCSLSRTLGNFPENSDCIQISEPVTEIDIHQDGDACRK